MSVIGPLSIPQSQPPTSLQGGRVSTISTASMSGISPTPRTQGTSRVGSPPAAPPLSARGASSPRGSGGYPPVRAAAHSPNHGPEPSIVHRYKANIPPQSARGRMQGSPPRTNKDPVATKQSADAQGPQNSRIHRPQSPRRQPDAPSNGNETSGAARSSQKPVDHALRSPRKSPDQATQAGPAAAKKSPDQVAHAGDAAAKKSAGGYPTAKKKVDSPNKVESPKRSKSATALCVAMLKSPTALRTQAERLFRRKLAHRKVGSANQSAAFISEADVLALCKDFSEQIGMGSPPKTAEELAEIQLSSPINASAVPKRMSLPARSPRGPTSQWDLERFIALWQALLRKWQAEDSIGMAPTPKAKATRPVSSSVKQDSKRAAVAAPDSSTVKQDSKKAPVAAPNPSTVKQDSKRAPVQHKPSFVLKRQALLTATMHGSPYDSYEVVKQLGQGAFGEVALVKHKQSGQQKALKSVRLKNSDMSPAQLKQEVNHLAKLDHPHIMKLFEYYEDEVFFYIVSEFAGGGELFHVIAKVHEANELALTETWIKEVMRQIVQAIAYCHAISLVHKDIKPQNILFLTEVDLTTNPHVVLADLGIAEMVDAKKKKKGDGCGTLDYMAPEVYNKITYGPKCDVWSLGALMYQVLSGYVPFEHYPPDEDRYNREAKEGGPLRRLLAAKNPCSEEAANVALKMLTYNQKSRPSSEQVLQDTWFNSDTDGTSTKPLRLHDDHVKAITAFHELDKLQQAVLAKVASQVAANDIQHINAAFRAIDTDNLGTLSFQEIIQALSSLGVTGDAAEKAARAMDMDKNGDVSYSEFVAGCMSRYDDRLESMLVEAFHAMDRDGSGTIDKKELGKLLKMGWNKTHKGQEHAAPHAEELDQIWNKLAGDEGTITMEKFKAHFKNNSDKEGSQRKVLIRKKTFTALPQKVLDQLYLIFQRIDTDASGELTAREIAVFWGRCFGGSRAECFRVLEALDQDGNGLVSWDEFVAFFQLTAAQRSGVDGGSKLQETQTQQEILEELKSVIFGEGNQTAFKEFAQGRRRLSSQGKVEPS